jgi:BASS family bile acid:Na+ symporter
MEALQHLIRSVIALSLTALIFSVGLDATVKEVTSLFRQPKRLVSAIVAVNVATPIAAAALIAIFPLSGASKLGLMLMAVSPVPPFTPAKVVRGGAQREYAYGLYAALVVLAVIAVPVTVALLSRIYGVPVAIGPAEVAKEVAVAVLLPLCAGLLARWRFPAFAERASPVIAKIALVLVVAAALFIAVALWPKMWALVGDGTVAAAVLMVVAALAAGHVLGGPARDARAGLAVTAATRHPGIALMIARANDLDKRVSVAIVLVLLVGFIAVAPYYFWQQRRLRRAD